MPDLATNIGNKNYACDFSSDMHHPGGGMGPSLSGVQFDPNNPAITDECPRCGEKTELRPTWFDNNGNGMDPAHTCPQCGPLEPMFQEVPETERFPQAKVNKKGEPIDEKGNVIRVKEPLWLKGVYEPPKA